MTLESSEGAVSSQLANVDELVCGAGGKTVVALPVHVEGGCLVVGKLLLHLGEGRERGGRSREGGEEVGGRGGGRAGEEEEKEEGKREEGELGAKGRGKRRKRRERAGEEGGEQKGEER